MKKLIDWKLFGVLLVASMVATLLVLPYTVALSPALAKAFSPLILLASIIQGSVLFSIFIFFGLLLASRVGLGLPHLEGFLKGQRPIANGQSMVRQAIVLGVVSGLLVILLSFLFPDLSITFLKAEMSVATWKGFLASFYGGIGEEIFARLFVMTLFVWAIFKMKKTGDNRCKACHVRQRSQGD